MKVSKHIETYGVFLSGRFETCFVFKIFGEFFRFEKKFSMYQVHNQPKGSKRSDASLPIGLEALTLQDTVLVL